MVTAFDVEGNELVSAVADKLKAIDLIKPPAWATFVKTGMHKERPPTRQDWWYSRAASVLRSIYILGPVGVSKLRAKYGGRKNRGHKPDKFFKGSGNILRKILQQLEKAQLVKQQQKGIHKGRIIAPKGRSLLDNTAKELFKKIQRPARQEKAAEKHEQKDVKQDKPKAEVKAEKPKGAAQ